jgi:predicted nucleic acid-binding protein
MDGMVARAGRVAVITAVDTSVLVAIYKGEADGEAWLDLLWRKGALGKLVVCDVVIAEIAALFVSERETLAFFEDLGLDYDPIDPSSAILAGQIFKAYRRTGGPREHLIPDFLIGAHALRQSNQLAATDKGYLRRYFPKLKVVAAN